MTDDFVVEHYADFGTEEPWVFRLVVGLPQLMQPVFPQQHEAFCHALVGPLFDALGKAFEDLRQLQRQTHKSAATLTAENAYETFYGKLWRAHKDRFPPVMATLGLDVGFLFQKDALFEKRATELLEKRPKLEDLVGLMRVDRRHFQNGLATYRNDHLEHRNRPVNPRLLAALHRIDSAATMFDNVWEAIEDYIVLYAMANLRPGIEIVQIPEDKRDPDRPMRFGFSIPSLQGL